MPRPIALAALSLAALAMLLSTTAGAAPKKKAKKRVPVSTCAHFDQVDKEDSGVDLVVANRCEINLSCSVSWTVKCQPRTGRGASSQHGAAFELQTGSEQSTLASPTECGNDGWVIDDVTWSCAPQAPAP